MGSVMGVVCVLWFYTDHEEQKKFPYIFDIVLETKNTVKTCKVIRTSVRIHSLPAFGNVCTRKKLSNKTL